MLARLPDGSFTSLIGGVEVRVIAAMVTVSCHDGTRYGGEYRLATTLLDHRAFPAPALMSFYNERWEHEVAYLALRHTLLQGRILRSGDPAGLQQETWALLALYQALRTAIADAVQSVPGTDPGPATRSPSPPRRTSSPPPATSPTPTATWPATSAAQSSPTSTRPAGPASAPAASSPRSAAGAEQAALIRDIRNPRSRWKRRHADLTDVDC